MRAGPEHADLLSGIPDPLHEEAGPGSAWSRVNISEAIPGVPTPLTWSFWLPAQELGILGAWHDLGIAAASEVRVGARPDDRLAAIFYGRPAGNLDLMRRMADRTPGTSGDALESQFHGRRRPGIVSVPTRSRYPWIAIKLPATVARLPARLRRLRRQIHPWWQRATGPGAADSDAALIRDLRDSYRAFLRVMRTHSALSFLSQPLFEQVRRLAERAGQPGLESVLVSGYGGLEETAEVVCLWEVARGARTLASFLADFGFHAPAEGEISSRSWREDAGPLEAVLRGLREGGVERSPAEAERRQARKRGQAERELLEALPRGRRAEARLLLATARRFIPLREHGKATFLRVLDVARRAARARGRRLAERGMLEDPEDAFLLSVGELCAGDLAEDVRELVAHRRARRAAYLCLELADAWVGMPRPRPVDETPAPQGGRIQALGVSPGVFEGRARVVRDPARDADFEPGEVLVCPMTDPSWASLLMIAGAAVIDIGGPLSHGAIFARELGIPCVINAGDASRRLRGGEQIRVDGAAGTVEVIAAAGVGGR